MKTATSLACSTCGFSSPKWFGRCPDCGDWNTATGVGSNGSAPLAIIALNAAGSSAPTRSACGIADVDRVLGGGLVPGEVVLLAGEPGIGKSTLVLQILAGLRAGGHGALLATGEETLRQVGERARRLFGDDHNLEATDCADVELLAKLVADGTHDVVAIDSIQTLVDSSVQQGSGSVTQVRESVLRLAAAARRSGTAIVLTGHVTKDGSVAGPKILEHVVDAVVSLEGERGGPLRLLCALKNRYGSCDETGIFQMSGSGLLSVDDPSRMMLSDRRSQAIGSVVFPGMTGTRPVLVEVQALVVESDLPQPRRVAIGFDPRRLTLALAVLNQRLRLPPSKRDVFVAVAGGILVREPAIDLALTLAILSAVTETPLGDDVVAFGEIGLAGEVRRVPAAERRLSEASRLGFRRALVPPACDTQSFDHALSVRDVEAALRFFVPDKA
ncbi:MAG: DNA repair protein RadA [Actinomycetota bacterium]